MTHERQCPKSLERSRKTRCGAVLGPLCLATNEDESVGADVWPPKMREGERSYEGREETREGRERRQGGLLSEKRERIISVA